MSRFEKFLIDEGYITLNYDNTGGELNTFEYYDQPKKKKKDRFQSKNLYKGNKASEVKLDSTDTINVAKRKQDNG